MKLLAEACLREPTRAEAGGFESLSVLDLKNANLGLRSALFLAQMLESGDTYGY